MSAGMESWPGIIYPERYDAQTLETFNVRETREHLYQVKWDGEECFKEFSTNKLKERVCPTLIYGTLFKTCW